MNHHPSHFGHPLTPHQSFSLYESGPSGYHAAGGPSSSSSFSHGNGTHSDGGMYGHSTTGFSGAVEMDAGVVGHTQSPLVTGTSVLGLKYADGVMLAADNLASYGSLARFRDIQRLHPLGDSCCLAVAGDMSDFQYLKKVLEGLIIKERNASLTDSHPGLHPEQLYQYLSNVMYARRTKMNPLWNAMILGGYKKGESFLGYVDLLGTTYTSPTLATGFASHFAQPLLREAYEKKAAEFENGKGLMSREEAEAVMDDCMKVLFYRDARSLNKYQIATITSAGVEISASRSAPTQWGFAEGLRGYGAQKQ